MDNTKRGQIYHERNYLRSKLLDHSDWAAMLPRRITPSDIDFVFDDDGRILLSELSSSISTWSGIKAGQRRLYESMVKAGKGDIYAVLAHHADVETINTTKHIRSFQVMYLDNGHITFTGVRPGNEWVPFVMAFYGLNKKQNPGLRTPESTPTTRSVSDGNSETEQRTRPPIPTTAAVS